MLLPELSAMTATEDQKRPYVLDNLSNLQKLSRDKIKVSEFWTATKTPKEIKKNHLRYVLFVY